MNRIDEINKRLAAIEAELTTDGADLDALNAEVDALIEERNGLEAQETQRRNILANIAKGAIGNHIETPQEERGNMDFDFNKEYRSAWVKNLMGVPMTDTEQRAFSTSSVKAIPTELADEIISKIKAKNPLFSKITLLNVKGNVTFAVEGTTKDAAIHTENSSISADADTMVSVDLSAYEITKLVQISASASSMSINAFENWLIDNISDRIAAKALNLMLYGTGSSQPKGIDRTTWTADTNAVEVALASSTAAADILKLISLLPSAYDAKAVFTMSKKTLFTDLVPLQDKSKNDLVQIIDGKFYIYGYEVIPCDDIELHEAYLGDFSKVVANMAVGEEVIKAFDINTNSYKYLGAATFDSKLALSDAIVKLVKKSS